MRGIDKKKSHWQKLILKQVLAKNVPIATVFEAHQKKEEFIFLDTRSRNEFDVSHIPGALYVGYDDFNVNFLQGFSLEDRFILYCSVGIRSSIITRRLMEVGYRNVYNLYGGIFDWLSEGYSIIDLNNQPTLNIHCFNRLFAQWPTHGKKIY